MLTENPKWHKVSLRIAGDRIPIDQIATLLGIQPSYIGRIGEHINNNPRHPKHNMNVWVWRYTTDPSTPFEDQVSNLLDKLELKKQEIENILSIPDTDGELFLGFGSISGQGGAYFSREILARISVLGLAISLDLYPSGQGFAETAYDVPAQT